jgi:hypothetical protein
MKMKSSGMPRNLRVRANYVCSAKGKACVKSRYAIRMPLSRVCASSIHRLRCVMAREHERPTRKLSCSGLVILCASL